MAAQPGAPFLEHEQRPAGGVEVGGDALDGAFQGFFDVEGGGEVVPEIGEQPQVVGDVAPARRQKGLHGFALGHGGMMPGIRRRGNRPTTACRR